MFVVISKFFDNGKVKILQPMYAENAKPKSEFKIGYDIYTDVFDTYERAEKFYNNQIDEAV